MSNLPNPDGTRRTLPNPDRLPEPVHRYNPAAVDAAIAQARRRSRVSGREDRLIHALLKGR